MRPGALPCTIAHARQDRSGAAAAHRSQHDVSFISRRGGRAALALAYAFLAGNWDPPAMGRRGKRALDDRRKWITDLAHIVRAGYPERPSDRPRELAEFIAACDLFTMAVQELQRPMKIRVWMASPTEMAEARWPVP